MRLPLLLAVLATLAAGGCGDSSGPDSGPVARVALDALPDTIGVGDTIAISAAALGASGQPLDGQTPTITIVTTPSTGVAALAPDHRLAALGEGRVLVRASIGTRSDTTSVRVERLPRALRLQLSDSLLLAPRIGVTPSDSVATFAPLVLDGLGAPLPPELATTFSTNPAAVSVSNGQVHAVAKGSAWVGAAVGALRDSVLVTVGYARFTNPVPFVEVDVAPFPSGNWCALDTAGAAYCYGTNLSGELGGGAAATGPGPVAVVGGHVFRRIGVNQNDACALDTQDVMYCWGANLNAELGLGTRSPSKVSEPTAAGGALRFRDLTLGSVTVRPFACGVTLDGDLYCWGTNGAGQLGSAGPDSSTPVQLLPGLKFVAVDQTCAVTSEGAIYCW